MAQQSRHAPYPVSSCTDPVNGKQNVADVGRAAAFWLLAAKKSESDLFTADARARPRTRTLPSLRTSRRTSMALARLYSEEASNPSLKPKRIEPTGCGGKEEQQPLVWGAERGILSLSAS